jgi:two-component system response regulator DctR
MQPLLDATVYIVDDDASVREALAWMLRTRRLSNEIFDSGEMFLADMDRHFLRASGSPKSETISYVAKYPSCLLLDVRMPRMSGLELFNELLKRELAETLPIIFLTGHADVPTAVDAVKRGAFDFCEKPFSNNVLVDRIEAALRLSDVAIIQTKAQSEIEKKLSELTEREQAVMRLVIAGLPNKVIADQLSISMRTVEVHRARVFDKIGVKSAVELSNVVRIKSKSPL